MNFYNLKMHLFKLKNMKIDKEMRLLERQYEIDNCSIEEKVDELKEIIDSYKIDLAKLRNEIPKVEELCDCFESIRLCEENGEIFGFEYWYFFFKLNQPPPRPPF